MEEGQCFHRTDFRWSHFQKPGKGMLRLVAPAAMFIIVAPAASAASPSRRLVAQHHPTACVACCACAKYVSDDFGVGSVLKHNCRVGHCSAAAVANNWCWDDSPKRLPLGIQKMWGDTCAGQPGFPRCDEGSPCSYSHSLMKVNSRGRRACPLLRCC
jgi:hypothetical protein